jgi:ATP-dependent DNA helicase PIF1
MNEFPLTNDQQRIFDIVESSNANVCIHGVPGSGKSVLNNALQNSGKKSYTMGAPTGLAAQNINGKTIHSIFGIPVSFGVIAPTFNKFTNNRNQVANITYNIKRLIIDEISMVRADQLDYIDRCLRFFKRVNLPFGGIQVIAVGDFFQLPPIVKGEERKQFTDYGYESEFAFHARAFSSMQIESLTEVLRQKGDNKFIKLLHEVRMAEKGSLSLKHMVMLNDRVDEPDGICIRLVGANDQADAINHAELAKLPGESVEFHAQCFGEWEKYPVDQVITLKIGAQILVKKNKADIPMGQKGDSDIVNGTLGVVEEIIVDDPELKRIVVRLRNGNLCTIYEQRWERKIKTQIDDVWDEKTVAGYEQLPVSLAWAISIHKSQGMTMERVHIDLSRIFSGGQVYVALSRCKTLEGITLESRISREKVYANSTVLKYFANAGKMEVSKL